MLENLEICCKNGRISKKGKAIKKNVTKSRKMSQNLENLVKCNKVQKSAIKSRTFIRKCHKIQKNSRKSRKILKNLEKCQKSQKNVKNLEKSQKIQKNVKKSEKC